MGHVVSFVQCTHLSLARTYISSFFFIQTTAKVGFILVLRLDLDYCNYKWTYMRIGLASSPLGRPGSILQKCYIMNNMNCACFYNMHTNNNYWHSLRVVT